MEWGRPVGSVRRHAHWRALKLSRLHIWGVDGARRKPKLSLQPSRCVLNFVAQGGCMKIRCCKNRGVLFLYSFTLCAIFPLLLVGSRTASSQSSLESDVDNARIIEMTHKGLGDDVIVARIKASPTKFELSDDDLAKLKKEGVSDAVVAAMIESTQLAVAKVKIDGNPVELRVIGEQKTGGRLGHTLTMGIESVKNKAYLQGQHASVIVSRAPVIDIELPANESIDNYIVVLMDDKGDRREIEMGSAGGTVGQKVGIRADRIARTSAAPLGGRRYRITSVRELKKGEYILYSVGSADFSRGVYGQGYDFSVQ
jgi:hypothetical protein